MGQRISSIRKRDVANPPDITSAPPARKKTDLAKYVEIMNKKGIIPDIFLVHETPSSQYIDEDGDIANEFYTEKVGRLYRVVDNLRPKVKTLTKL
uniref:Porphobilinogen synthase n=1 Tax=Heterorhabditis bacteriophora TaxID=37862 RepID=A0A1I7WNE7_HETBA